MRFFIAAWDGTSKITILSYHFYWNPETKWLRFGSVRKTITNLHIFSSYTFKDVFSIHRYISIFRFFRFHLTIWFPLVPSLTEVTPRCYSWKMTPVSEKIGSYIEVIVVAKFLSATLSCSTEMVALITWFKDKCNSSSNIILSKCWVLRSTPECQSRQHYGRKSRAGS